MNVLKTIINRYQIGAKRLVPIDAEEVLAPFFNKYIYHGGSSFFVKVLSWTIFITFTIAYRAAKWWLARPSSQHYSPSTRYHIKKSFAKEGVTPFVGEGHWQE